MVTRYKHARKPSNGTAVTASVNTNRIEEIACWWLRTWSYKLNFLKSKSEFVMRMEEKRGKHECNVLGQKYYEAREEEDEIRTNSII